MEIQVTLSSTQRSCCCKCGRNHKGLRGWGSFSSWNPELDLNMTVLIWLCWNKPEKFIEGKVCIWGGGYVCIRSHCWSRGEPCSVQGRLPSSIWAPTWLLLGPSGQRRYPGPSEQKVNTATDVSPPCSLAAMQNLASPASSSPPLPPVLCMRALPLAVMKLRRYKILHSLFTK